MKLLTVFTALVILYFTTACNTMEGFGQDMQKGGEKIEKSADEKK